LVHRSTRAVLLAAMLLIGFAPPVLAQSTDVTSQPGGSLLAVSLAWLVPIGLGLVACGAVPPGRVVTVIRVGWLALGAATIVYWVCGFAFQFGGIGFAVAQPDLAGLAREWSWAPLDASWGSEWGVIGLVGYLLRGPASTPMALALFFSQLPWIVTAVAIPLWSMQGRARPFALFLSAILFALLYTLLGNWIWGGGWLANLGLNLGLGRGLLDLGGASLVHLAGAASALAGMLAFGTRAFTREPAEQLPLPTLEVVEATGQVAPEGEAYVPMPPLHLPLFATLGAWLVLIGSMGWLIDTPAHIVGEVPASWVETGITLVLAAAGGAMTALAFSWLTTGEGNGLMTARGAVGALIAASAGASLLPQWAALALGAAVGMFVPLVQYLGDRDAWAPIAGRVVGAGRPGSWHPDAGATDRRDRGAARRLCPLLAALCCRAGPHARLARGIRPSFAASLPAQAPGTGTTAPQTTCRSRCARKQCRCCSCAGGAAAARRGSQ
jgi:Amt family ammonium transporter